MIAQISANTRLFIKGLLQGLSDPDFSGTALWINAYDKWNVNKSIQTKAGEIFVACTPFGPGQMQPDLPSRSDSSRQLYFCRSTSASTRFMSRASCASLRAVLVWIYDVEELQDLPPWLLTAPFLRLGMTPGTAVILVCARPNLSLLRGWHSCH